jgi:hypothetical protein
MGALGKNIYPSARILRRNRDVEIELVFVSSNTLSNQTSVTMAYRHEAVDKFFIEFAFSFSHLLVNVDLSLKELKIFEAG